MISGVVNAQNEATIHISVYGTAGVQREIDTVVDAGFTGALTLPPSIIAALGLPWRSRGSALLANGSVDEFDIHTATVIWDGIPRSILIEAADTDPLIGMRLIAGFELRIEAVIGGKVTIEALP